MSRAQIITEFAVFIAIALLVAIIFVAYTVSEAKIAADIRHERAVKQQLSSLQQELLAAYIAHDGYETTLSFSPPYQGVNMALEISQGRLFVSSSRFQGSIRIPPVDGDLTITSGTILVRKRDGIVEVSA